MKNNGVKIIIALLLVAVVGLSIAYAALSSTLNITFGNVTQTVQTWGVRFKAASNLAANSTYSYSTSDAGYACGTATVSSDGKTVTVTNTKLSKPQDKCVWALTIQNTGTIGAKLSNIEGVNPPAGCVTESVNVSMTCDKLSFVLSTNTNGTAPLAKDSTLAGGAELPVYLVAYYNSTSSLGSSAVTLNNFGFKLDYVQN